VLGAWPTIRLVCGSAGLDSSSMKLGERLRRWWKPGEYDDERPVDDNDGHPLSEDERHPRPLVGELGGFYGMAGTSVTSSDDDFRPSSSRRSLLARRAAA